MMRLRPLVRIITWYFSNTTLPFITYPFLDLLLWPISSSSLKPTRTAMPDTLEELKNYNVVKYAMDERSDHGGLAYYNPEDKTLIVVHWGSVTKRDWLVTEVQIAVGVKETLKI